MHLFVQMDQQKNNDTLLHLNLQQDVDEERQVEDDHLHSETDRLQQTAYTPRVNSHSPCSSHPSLLFMFVAHG